jgi:hypothetical protein
MFGRYPWQCAICGEERMLHRRGAKIRKATGRSEELEPGETAGEHAHQH